MCLCSLTQIGFIRTIPEANVLYVHSLGQELLKRDDDIAPHLSVQFLPLAGEEVDEIRLFVEDAVSNDVRTFGPARTSAARR